MSIMISVLILQKVNGIIFGGILMYDYLLILALILLFTKLFGLLTEKVSLPQVLGALTAGILLGPSGVGILHETDFLVKTSEIGVILLMFIAGIDTDINEFKSTGKASFVTALLGVIVPIVLCGAVYFAFYEDSMSQTAFIKVLFIGVIFAATSVSITLETLNEMGQAKNRIGNTIMGAAIIDDIIGIIVLSAVIGMSGDGVSIASVLLKIIEFFVFTAVVGFIVHIIFKKLDHEHARSRRVAVWALSFCFFMSYAAEEFFGVADITGAYFAGLILCNIAKTKSILNKKLTVVSYMIFSPIFFAGIGIKTDLTGLNSGVLIFSAVLFAVAVLSKIIGCGLGAKMFGLTNKEALSVGVGMVARGEVAFMVAQKGIDAGFISEEIFPAIVLVVLLVTIITPVLLKIVLANKKCEKTTDSEITAVEG